MPQLLGYGLPFLLVGIITGFITRYIFARIRLSSAEQRAKGIILSATKEAEVKKREAILETKDQLFKERNNFEKEVKERRYDLQRKEKRLLQREESLDNRFETLEKKEKGVFLKEKNIADKEARIKKEWEEKRKELERISGLSAEEAKKMLIKSLEEEAKYDASVIINKIEEETKRTADKKARDIIVSTIQRLATDVTADVTTSSVSLPNDEMKGRIIGREGRNIRTMETLIGVDIIIDDTPEAVVISSFNSMRREIARVSLERLIADGRIHPSRIEEVIAKVKKEIDEKIFDEGEKAVLDLGIQGINPEGIKCLGRLHFRTSYGQNVLEHSKEVAKIAAMIAAEVGADVELAKRGGLLHDIGKSVESEGEGSHTEIGCEIAKKLGESDEVINIIVSHHGEKEQLTLESTIVQAADAISAARPGARRETLESYIKRLENLEKIAEEFEGVSKTYAIQAGREIRVMVNSDTIDDGKSKDLAKNIAKKIEAELKYPGKIKVTVIRETRIIEYAR
jgi:ribonuclease Y